MSREVTYSWSALVEAARAQLEARGAIVLNTLPGRTLGTIKFVVSDDAVTPWSGPLRPGEVDPRD